MKGLICAGGHGTRLLPLTKVINKHLVPVNDRPMIYYALEKMQSAGIKEVLIVTGIDQCGTIIEQLGDGKEWNLNLTYKVQTEAGGIAQAVALAENFAAGDSLFVILGDNIFTMDIKEKLSSFTSGCMLFLKHVHDPERFGVASFSQKAFDSSGRVYVNLIEEKPVLPKSSFAVTGIYVYDSTVFDRIRKIRPSARGELEITDVNNSYLSDNQVTAYLMSDNDLWSDAGTFESLYTVNSWFRNQDT